MIRYDGLPLGRRRRRRHARLLRAAVPGPPARGRGQRQRGADHPGGVGQARARLQGPGAHRHLGGHGHPGRARQQTAGAGARPRPPCWACRCSPTAPRWASGRSPVNLHGATALPAAGAHRPAARRPRPHHPAPAAAADRRDPAARARSPLALNDAILAAYKQMIADLQAELLQRGHRADRGRGRPRRRHVHRPRWWPSCSKLFNPSRKVEIVVADDRHGRRLRGAAADRRTPPAASPSRSPARPRSARSSSRASRTACATQRARRRDAPKLAARSTARRVPATCGNGRPEKSLTESGRNL